MHLDERHLKMAVGVVLGSVCLVTGCTSSPTTTSEDARRTVCHLSGSGVCLTRTNAEQCADLGARFRDNGDREALQQLLRLAELLPDYAIEQLFRLGTEIKKQGLCDLLGPVVLRGLQSPNWRVFDRACFMVEWLTKDAELAADLLLGEIQSEKPDRASYAVWALRSMGPRARPAVPALLAKLTCDSQPAWSTERSATQFEIAVLRIVRSAGLPDSQSAEKMRPYLYLRDDLSRRVAARCLLEYDVHDSQAAEELVRQLRAPDKHVVSDTLWGMRGMRQLPDDVVSAVAKAAEEDCRSNRGRVAIRILSDLARRKSDR